jgi:Flp pilus assembly protein TadD
MRWPYYLAHVYRRKNDMEKAAASFERALRLRPTDLAALVYLGETYLALGRPDAAEGPLAKAVSLEPRLAIALVGLGRAALAKDAYADAAQFLERALALDPRASTIRHPLAMAYRGLGQPERAAMHLSQRGDVRASYLPDPLMLELDELLASPQVYEYLGTQALNRAEWPAAASYLGKAVALAPGEPSAHLKLAEALRRTGMPAEALRHYEHAVSVAPAGTDPRGPGARLGYAMVLVQLGRYRDARDRLREGMELHPDQPRFAHALVRLLAAAPDDGVRDPRRAFAMVEQLLQKEPDDSGLVETMAMALASVGEFDRAAALQRSLIEAATRAGYQDLVPGMTDNLELYEARQRARTLWTDVTMP